MLTARNASRLGVKVRNKVTFTFFNTSPLANATLVETGMKSTPLIACIVPNAGSKYELHKTLMSPMVPLDRTISIVMVWFALAVDMLYKLDLIAKTPNGELLPRIIKDAEIKSEPSEAWPDCTPVNETVRYCSNSGVKSSCNPSALLSVADYAPIAGVCRPSSCR